MRTAGGDQSELDLGLVPPAPVIPDGVWQLMLPWSSPPLNLNDRSDRFTKARKVREVRDAAAYLAREAGIPTLPRIRVQLHYVPRDRRKRDNENLVATQKPAIDGLRDALVVADDHDELVVRRMPKIHPPRRGGRGQLVLVVEALEATSCR